MSLIASAMIDEVHVFMISPLLTLANLIVHVRIMYVYRDSSLTARYARGKPHPCLKAFGTSAGFSNTQGYRYAVAKATKRDIAAVRKCRDVVEGLMGEFLQVRDVSKAFHIYHYQPCSVTFICKLCIGYHIVVLLLYSLI